MSKFHDSAFKELFGLSVVLVSVIYGLLFWLAVPSKNLVFVADSTIAITVPLAVYVLLLARRSFTSSRSIKSILSLIAWGSITTSCMVDGVFLATILLLSTHVNYFVLYAVVTVGVCVVGLFLIPYEKVVAVATDSSVNRSSDQISYLRRWKWRSRSFACFFITGVCATGVIVLLPFALFPIV